MLNNNTNVVTSYLLILFCPCLIEYCEAGVITNVHTLEVIPKVLIYKGRLLIFIQMLGHAGVEMSGVLTNIGGITATTSKFINHA